MSGVFWHNISLFAISPSAGGSLKAAMYDAACHSTENSFFVNIKKGVNLLPLEADVNFIYWNLVSHGYIYIAMKVIAATPWQLTDLQKLTQ